MRRIENGFDIKVTIIVGSSNISATQKLFGHGFAIIKCHSHRCPKRSRYSEKFKKTHYGDMHNYEQWITESADPQKHRQYVQEWLKCDTRGTREAHFKINEVRCHRCPKRSRYSEKFKKTHYGDMHNYEQWITESADPQKHRQYVQEWLKCDTRGTREAHFKINEVRWSKLLRLPYMDLIRFTVVDPMHCLFLGIAKWIIQFIFIKENKLNSE
ncbi:hypothetical protein Glove_197g131 [Diversispora epigaea]|uniref:Uncharacterized protein n=1 Tax=Diversispora epigaea TaxID=1348612 RepID=A0A397ITI8_9GLOM|nr:hypothetical protein Glove_197g131 [Diversispora epigaea]